MIALCRCGRSRLKPLCDGSHRLSKFRDAATATQIGHVLDKAVPEPSPDAAPALRTGVRFLARCLMVGDVCPDDPGISALGPRPRRWPG